MNKSTLHIGVKSVLLTDMNRLEYNQYRGWDLPDDENGSDEGYLVEYLDGKQQSNHSEHCGYISWSPKEVADSAYRPCGSMLFSHALEALKNGYTVSRKSWTGNERVYLVGKNSYKAITNEANKIANSDGMVEYDAYFAYVNSENTVSIWSPSHTDILSDDWSAIK